MTLVDHTPATRTRSIEGPAPVSNLTGSRLDLDDMLELAGSNAMAYSAFLAGHIGPQDLPRPNWGPIGETVYDRTYSRDIYVRDADTGEIVLDADGQKVLQGWWTWERPTHDRETETLAETARRVVQGNLGYAPATTYIEAEDVALFSMIYDFLGSPAGRHLWVAGTGLPYSRNCWSSPFGPLTSDHLRFTAMRLFEGGGVGANYSNDLLARTTPVAEAIAAYIACSTEHPEYDQIAQAAGDRLTDNDNFAGSPSSEFADALIVRVDDTREGWVKAWTLMIDMATGHTGGNTVIFDVSDIRPFGAPLKTFGGRASGPAPLVEAILGINTVLAEAYHRGATAGSPTHLASLEAMQVDHLAAAAVVAGGARRSARMSMKHWADQDIFDFINAKADPSQHWTTNISVEVDDEFRAALGEKDHPLHTHAEAVLDDIAEGMTRDGEPGMVDTSVHSRFELNPIRITNPCGEVGLSFEPGDLNGQLGAGESCNLGSVNLERFGTDIGGAVKATELMARFLYRATLKPYPGEDASRIESRNRRIGVGIMGLHGWVMSHGVKLSELPSTPRLLARLTDLRLAARRSADGLADALGLPRPVKVTAVAPTGSISQKSGTQPGVSSVMFKHFIRRVRYASHDPQLADLAARGYHIEDDIYAANTKVVSFPTRDASVDRYGLDLVEDSTDLDFGQYLDLVAAVENSFCGGADGMAVSSTCQIPEGTDATMVAREIKRVLGTVKGLTAFPAATRPQQPYEAVTKEQFEQMVAELDLPSNELVTVGDSNDGDCATGACPVK